MRLDELRLDFERQRSQIPTNTDPMAAQQLDDFAKFVECLDKRLHDLKVAKVMCLQTAAEIRMIQANSRDLVGQYKDIKAMTIPAWEKQFTLVPLAVKFLILRSSLSVWLSSSCNCP